MEYERVVEAAFPSERVDSGLIHRIVRQSKEGAKPLDLVNLLYYSVKKEAQQSCRR